MSSRRQMISELKPFVAKLSGATLSSISIGVYDVDFEFLSGWKIILRLNKIFIASISNAAVSSFDPTSDTHDPSLESANFVFLKGLNCDNAACTESKFCVSFS